MSRVSLGASRTVAILLCVTLANHVAAQSGGREEGYGSGGYGGEYSGEMGGEGGFGMGPGGEYGGRELTSAERIEAALNQRLQQPLQYESQPLNEIIDTLQEQFGIPIMFDTAALDEVAISPDIEVTLNLRNLSLRSVLNILLRQPGLGELCYSVVDEVLLITTKEKAYEKLILEVYRVDDLTAEVAQVPGGNPENPYSSLVQVITRCVQSDTWTASGSGEGEIHLMQPGMLVVTQTKEIQDQVQALLVKLRETKTAIQGE